MSSGTDPVADHGDLGGDLSALGTVDRREIPELIPMLRARRRLPLPG